MRNSPSTMLLPDVPDGQDACIGRLRTPIAAHDIARARDDRRRSICVHFSPPAVTFTDVERWCAPLAQNSALQYGHVSPFRSKVPLEEDAGRGIEDLPVAARVLSRSHNVSARFVRT